MFKNTRSLWLVFVLAALLLTFVIAGAATVPEQATGSETIYRGLVEVVNFDVSPRLDSMPSVDIPAQQFIEIYDDLDSGLEGPLGPQDADGALQDFVGAAIIPTPIISFNGPNNIAGVAPPDPVGDIGPNHYVAMSNLYFAVYSRTGAVAPGFPKANNTLWSGFGGDCETDNSGDPIVVYDQLADRWVLTQFTASGPTYFECIAVSTTGDPTGSYYRYALSTGPNFPDYPKVGVWSDAYYVSTREFAGFGPFVGVGAYAINKAEIISGDPTPTVISFLAPPGGTPYNVGDGLLPADLDGTTLPPSSTTYFVGSMDNGHGYGAPQDALTIWEFTPDWGTPGNSTFTMVDTVSVAAFDSVFPCSPGSRSCIPQLGTSAKIDILSYRQRPINRLAYRNFGTHESLVTNQSVEATPGVGGTRWYEIRNPGSSSVIFQQGTFAPADGISRWMASIAMDKDGNMALGYSASNASMFPSIWYTGRLSSDPLGTLPQGEGVFINGTGSQTGGGNRWGDYSSMNVDPLDDCTFWYVNEYLPATSSSGWQLRIGSFKFPSCGSTTTTYYNYLPVVVRDSEIGGGGTSTTLWADDFDSYANNTNLHGVGGWKGWDNSAGATAFVRNTQARSSPHSVEIAGASDLVHEYSGATSGQWVFTAWSYIPGSFTGESYFLLLNEYQDLGPYNWSTQVKFSGGIISNDGASGGSMPYITDQWVEIRVEIDLDSNTQSFFYNNVLLYSGTWTEEMSGGGQLEIQVLDLYANGASAIYYDDISLVSPAH